MKNMGVGGVLLQWFCSFLAGRSQRVVISGIASETKHTNAGVPQGSIFAPLWFLIYINNIEKNIISKMLLFADDSTLFHTYSNPKDDEEIINKDLQQINKWSKQWLVEFNPSKTIFINFSLLKKRDTHLSFKNVPLLQVCQHKHLAIFLTEKL